MPRGPRLVLVLACLSGCAYLDTRDRDGFFDHDRDKLTHEWDCNDYDPTVTSGAAYYVDADGDGYGALTSVTACSAPTGYTPIPGDCDDADDARHPGAGEACNGLDDDCDGAFEDADPDLLGAPTWFLDDDRDGYGDLDVSVVACQAPPKYVSDATDCDDADRDAFPGGDEVCDDEDADEDCDGLSDDGDSAADGKIAWYLDVDKDGFGSGTEVIACDAPSGTTAEADDCDDTDPDAFPGALEVWYDGEDQACDGQDDYDQDGDGHRALAHGGDDCDDLVPTTFPGAVETWYDGVDADCSGGSDFDQDGDTHDLAGKTGFDCADQDAARFPGAPEFADGVDSDCDGKDWYCGGVYRRVPQDYADIGKAHAASCDGDTILVAPGQYEAPTTSITRRVTLAGSGIDDTVLVAATGTTTLDMDAGRLRDLTVRGQPGGITVQLGGSTNVTLQRVAVDGAGGGGLAVSNTTGTLVTDSTIGNCAQLNGAGINGSFALAMTIRRSTFTNNSGNSGAAINVGYATDFVLEDSEFLNNVTDGFGGAVALPFTRGNVVVRTSRFESNRGQYGAGVFMSDGGTLEDCEFIGNVAISQGAVRLASGDYEVHRLVFMGNNGGAGNGSLAITSGGVVNVSDLDIQGNISAVNWSTMILTADVLTVRGVRSVGNTRSGMLLQGPDMDVSEIVAAANGSAGVILQRTAGSGTVRARRITTVGNAAAGVRMDQAAGFPGSLTGVLSVGNAMGFERVNGTVTVPITSCALYGNATAFAGMNPVTCLTVDPGLQSWAPGLSTLQWDLHLAPGSALIDAGEASELDVDGTRADIGAYLAGTDVLGARAWLADDDLDGMYDGWEGARGLDPDSDDSAYDPDGDGLDNGEEFVRGTHPALRDSDGDAIDDAAEVTSGTDPLSPFDP